MNEADRREEIARVVATGMAEVTARDAQSLAGRRLSPRLAVLEGQLLERVLFEWLHIEDGRSEFRVTGCEVEHRLDLEGIALRLVIDRIDQLSDGRQVIIDYKSGNTVGVASWADERLREPQLPLYAALVFPDVPLAAIALARVHPREPKFVGVAPDGDGLPGMAVIGSGARNVAAYTRAGLTDWAALRQRWAVAVRQLAGDVRDGVAAVQVADESDLTYCDVLPLLRLAERRTQWRLADGLAK
jgi:exodeoxyribonuclease-5